MKHTVDVLGNSWVVDQAFSSQKLLDFVVVDTRTSGRY
jgi:hypothetical protein